MAEDVPFRRVDPSPGQQRSGSFGSRFVILRRLSRRALVVPAVVPGAASAYPPEVDWPMPPARVPVSSPARPVAPAVRPACRCRALAGGAASHSTLPMREGIAAAVASRPPQPPLPLLSLAPAVGREAIGPAASRACSSADRASASGAEGRRFESCRARSNNLFGQRQRQTVGVGGWGEAG